MRQTSLQPKPRHFKLTITYDGTQYAGWQLQPNGKTVQEGEQFGLLMGTQTYPMTLKRIEDGCVVLSRHDQEMVVPLQRR